MPNVVNTSGKRKTAVARATVVKGKGCVRINNVPVEIYQPELARIRIMEPLLLAKEKVSGVNIDVVVEGGGIMGQADAIRTAIARGITEFYDSPEVEETFRSFDRSLLINDIRRKEPKHQGGYGARKRRQKSYR